MEDIYDVSGDGWKLSDYLNAWYTPLVALQHENWDDKRLVRELKKHPIPSMEKRYRKKEEKNMRQVMSQHPKKVARLNKLAAMANTCTTVSQFKHIWNEVDRLLYGKEGSQQFPGKEYDPDLLKVK